MERKQAHEVLKQKVLDMGGHAIKGCTYVEIKVDGVKTPTHISVDDNGKTYELQVFLACEHGFTTIDIAHLLEDNDEYEWCWGLLKRVGITEDIFK